jgi:hypothetical protein
MQEKKIYFTVKCADKERVLFSVSERNGDLQIFPRSPKYHNSSVTLQAPYIPYAGEHFSVHQSAKSADGNLIKRTVRRAGMDDLVAHHFTCAFKRDCLFAHIYTARAPKLDDARYDVTQKVKRAIPIGKYAPSDFVLYYSLWVGPSDRVFKPSISDEISVTQFPFTSFQLVLLSSYACMFSDSTGGRIVPMTINPDAMPPELRSILAPTHEGRTEEQCFYEFKASRDALHDSYLQVIANNLSESKFAIFQDVMHRSRRLGFLPVGFRDSAQYTQRLRRLVTSL